ncbi:MAG: hypothetical protein M3O09_17885 [Acidobacteriota bacterium]|nr:hypothetical protein [Acidobacteriota bacterium]
MASESHVYGNPKELSNLKEQYPLYMYKDGVVTPVAEPTEYYSESAKETLKSNLTMSDSTWRKVLDPLEAYVGTAYRMGE